MRSNDDYMDGFCYNKDENGIRHDRVYQWQDEKILNASELKNGLQRVERHVRDLLIV